MRRSAFGRGVWALAAVLAAAPAFGQEEKPADMGGKPSGPQSLTTLQGLIRDAAARRQAGQIAVRQQTEYSEASRITVGKPRIDASLGKSYAHVVANAREYPWREGASYHQLYAREFRSNYLFPTNRDYDRTIAPKLSWEAAIPRQSGYQPEASPDMGRISDFSPLHNRLWRSNYLAPSTRAYDTTVAQTETWLGRRPMQAPHHFYFEPENNAAVQNIASRRAGDGSRLYSQWDLQPTGYFPYMDGRQVRAGNYAIPAYRNGGNYDPDQKRPFHLGF